MQFTEYDNIDHSKGWRFNGVCEDIKTGKIYMFCTNSIYEAREFRDGKEMSGMRFVSGKYNDNYKVIRRLLQNE